MHVPPTDPALEAVEDEAAAELAERHALATELLGPERAEEMVQGEQQAASKRQRKHNPKYPVASPPLRKQLLAANARMAGDAHLPSNAAPRLSVDVLQPANHACAELQCLGQTAPCSSVAAAPPPTSTPAVAVRHATPSSHYSNMAACALGGWATHTPGASAAVAMAAASAARLAAPTNLPHLAAMPVLPSRGLAQLDGQQMVSPVKTINDRLSRSIGRACGQHDAASPPGPRRSHLRGVAGNVSVQPFATNDELGSMAMVRLDVSAAGIGQ